MSWPSKKIRPPADRLETNDALEQGALASAVGADDGDDLALRDFD